LKPGSRKKVVVAITGASGAVYSLNLLRELGRLGISVDLVTSLRGRDMLERETRIPAQGQLLEHLATRDIPTGSFRLYDNDDLGAPPASGSYSADSMVICPCSTKTLSAVASASCRTLIERAAEVMLKERRRLILVIREAPYSLAQIENMRSVTLAGGMILPASPGFYHQPKEIADLVDFIVSRVLDHLGITHSLSRPWGETS